MFCIVAVHDIDVLKKIAKECGGEYLPECTLNTVLIVGERPSGVCMMRYSDKNRVRLEWVGVIPEVRGRGYGDFLTRASINKVIDISEYIEINGVDEYYEKFGFEKKGNIMIAESKKIVFPSKCKGFK